MKIFISKADFEQGFKTYKKEKCYYRFELSNGESVLEGNDIKNKALSRSVTKNKNLSYLVYNIWNHHPDNKTSVILYEITTNTTKPDWEEEHWYYCIIKDKVKLLEITFEQLTAIAYSDFSTIKQMIKEINVSAS